MGQVERQVPRWLLATLVGRSADDTFLCRCRVRRGVRAGEEGGGRKGALGSDRERRTA